MNSVTEKFTCPYASCSKTGFNEDELCHHCARFHGDENILLKCPICIARNIPGANKEVGSREWGFSSHLHHNHGPESRFIILQLMLSQIILFNYVIISPPFLLIENWLLKKIRPTGPRMALPL